MPILIGHASIDEHGNISGGAAGDQNGKEVCIRTWYNKPWNKVIRCTDSAIAEMIAKKMESACKNNNIGYNQSKRTTLYNEAKNTHWDIAAIKTKCNTDCSALVAVCVTAAGIPVSKDMYTGNEAAVLKATGKFIVLTESKYLTSDKYLKRGDILLKEGAHTAIALQNGLGETPQGNYYPQYIGASQSLTDGLKAIGVNNSFSNRKLIAAANGITNYSGTAAQNINLLEKLKNGTLKRI